MSTRFYKTRLHHILIKLGKSNGDDGGGGDGGGDDGKYLR